jgi:hypothetical protein
MSASNDEQRTLARSDSRFVEKLAEGYAPEPMAPARQVAFDEALRERIEGRSSRWRPMALAIPAAAALAAVWLFAGDAHLASAPDPVPVITAEAWEEALLSPDVLSDLDAREDDELLPEEYFAIASAFL